MAINRGSSPCKLIRIGFLLLLGLSTIYLTNGSQNKRKILASIRKYCRAMQWFDKRQRHICTKHPEMIRHVKKGVENALEECRRQFKDYRWNCSPLTWNQVFSEEGLLKKRSRETAFVQALTAASVMMEISQACAANGKKGKPCGCGSQPKSKRRSNNSKRKPRDVNEFWQGCPHNLQYGFYFAKRFMDPRRVTNHARKTRAHNQEVGRKLVRKLRVKKCKCHGKSDTCAYKICWYVTPPITNVGDHLWKMYNRSVRSQWNKTSNFLYRKDRSRREKITSTKLTYFAPSENFCQRNLHMSIMGTRGRQCNSTSTGSDSCKSMCCGRSFKTKYVKRKGKCNCRFVWCCQVECDQCDINVKVETCL
ncbi:protein Wnt-2-like [Xenia sp. Carnegie-2017]|uniref:protein Wnt-2-like n=1 Tax=Xenia sp. Carnegie-2017 TaxID=2897299 RepID=UPI001F03A979|nr:protein Wnt-2-like [Xenia sp. Carnegie-2017]